MEIKLWNYGYILIQYVNEKFDQKQTDNKIYEISLQLLEIG